MTKTVAQTTVSDGGDGNRDAAGNVQRNASEANKVRLTLHRGHDTETDIARVVSAPGPAMCRDGSTRPRCMSYIPARIYEAPDYE